MALASFRKLSQNPTKFTKKKINVFLQNIYPPPSFHVKIIYSASPHFLFYKVWIISHNDIAIPSSRSVFTSSRICTHFNYVELSRNSVNVVDKECGACGHKW